MHSGTKKFDVPLYFDRPTFFVDRCRTLEFKPNRNKKKNDKARSTFKSIIKIKKVDCYLAPQKNKDLIHYLSIARTHRISQETSQCKQRRTDLKCAIHSTSVYLYWYYSK